jgi:hypothetical protein
MTESLPPRRFPLSAKVAGIFYSPSVIQQANDVATPYRAAEAFRKAISIKQRLRVERVEGELCLTRIITT